MGRPLSRRSHRALVRRPSPRLAEGLLTHLDRVPVDADLARRQWEGYVAALRAEGWETVEVDAGRRLPRRGVRRGHRRRLRRPRGDRPAGRRRAQARDRRHREALRPLGYRIARIEAPGTLDGGDVLKHDGTVWVGLGGRTNQAGVEQLAATSRRWAPPWSACR